ncbi:MAG: class I SAM-dependent methyltransferase [Phycisphaerales bacterium]
MTTHASESPSHAFTNVEQQLSGELSVAAALENAAARVKHVQGWLHRIEGFSLMRLVAASHTSASGEVVEVGSFKGLSTCWLAMGAAMLANAGVKSGSGKVFAVDHFKGSPEHQPGGTHPDADIARDGTTLNVFNQNIAKAGLAEFVTPIEKPSREGALAWQSEFGGKPIRLCFIDGDHSYEASKEDWTMWSKFVPVGGYICLHDVGSWPGVTKFATELTNDPTCGFFRVFGVASLQVFRKVG